MMDLILALNIFCSNQFSAYHRAHCQEYQNRCVWMVKAPDYIQMYKTCASEYAKLPDPRKTEAPKTPAAKTVAPPKPVEGAGLPRTLPKQVKRPPLSELEKK